MYHNPERTDPALLARDSEIKSYETSSHVYPGLRVFYRRHQQADKLPTSPAPIPLLVFIHGLGGSVAQFHPLLSSITPIASCLAIDLPGCGRSAYANRSWPAYGTDELHREKDEGQSVVLIGHSMGTSLAALLANPRLPPRTELSKHIIGLVAICPSAGPPTEKEVSLFRKLLYIPDVIFDLWRAWDRRGGTESASVRRFVDLYNNQSRSPVWRRMAWGLLPTYRNGVPHGGLPTRDTWAGLDIPVFLVGGEDDNVTPATETKVASDSDSNGPEPVDDPTTPKSNNQQPLAIPALPVHPKKVVQSVILPKPATHALLYTPSTARILAGLISDFLVSNVTGRLDQAWQLQFLTQDGKWDVKNLEKWQKVAPVSEPIGGIFRALKTLREVDETHSPKEFVRNWGSTIKDIIDISHDNPVYDPKGLEEGGIRYHKFPTVSKVPPTDTEIEGFIKLVDEIRADQKERAAREKWEDGFAVGVHCHYGFNRTGYFIVCYLVEREGYRVNEAIEHFAKQRPKGIKHEHFRARLSVPAFQQPSDRTPLLAESSPHVSDQSEQRAEEAEDAALYNTALPDTPRSSRLRELALFSWAVLATAAVIVLGVVLQHRTAITSPSTPSATAASKLSTGKRNLVFMVSDGMGPASLSLTRSFRQLVDHLPIDDTLTLDRHFWGTSRTRSSSSLVTDSAAGATAFSCGRKSYNGAISMLPDFSPCGTQEDEIALQEIGEGVLGRTVDLMLGGGRCHFLPNTSAGSCRMDDIDVTKIAQEKHGWTYADDRPGFDALALGKNVSLPMLGLFAYADVPFEIDRRNMADVYPSLSEMAITALTALEEATKDSDKGFFLMIEGSRIDHAGHINDPAAQVREVLEYDKAFKTVLDFLDKSDTEGILVATSDHETGGLATAWQAPDELPVYNWHPRILAKANASSEHLARLLHRRIANTPEPIESLRKWIHSELVVKHLGITNAQETEINSLASRPLHAMTSFARLISQRARVGWSTHGHSAVDVNVYCSGGEGAEKIRGNVENTQIGEFLRGYLGVDVEDVTKELREGMARVIIIVSASLSWERNGKIA
ncbi:alkaline phosphatase-like protein [Cercophora scortea]|uniref:Alkaline phosphatase n=1 Tax=Cercophora scortea TaxID=314031 RepID=A0AAE0IYM6_9PEZI|nr:alkaline phosphatase-like protein [Cercophora scortea]